MPRRESKARGKTGKAVKGNRKALKTTKAQVEHLAAEVRRAQVVKMRLKYASLKDMAEFFDVSTATISTDLKLYRDQLNNESMESHEDLRLQGDERLDAMARPIEAMLNPSRAVREAAGYRPLNPGQIFKGTLVLEKIEMDRAKLHGYVSPTKLDVNDGTRTREQLLGDVAKELGLDADTLAVAIGDKSEPPDPEYATPDGEKPQE